MATYKQDIEAQRLEVHKCDDDSLQPSSTQPSTPTLTAKGSPEAKAYPLFVRVLLTIFPILSGWASVLNSGCTGKLSDLLGSDYWSAFFSNLLGTVITFALYFHGGSALEGLRRVGTEYKKNRWTLVAQLGGVFGAVFVVLYTAIPPITGFGLFFVCAVCGQVVGALALDRFGWLWRERIDILWYGYLGGAMVLVGTFLFQLDEIINMGSENKSKIGYALIGILAGLAFVVQTSCNVKCGDILGTPFRGSFATFLSGALVLLIPAFIDRAAPSFSEVNKSNWWPFVSGALSCYSVTVAIIIPQYIGFSATFCWAVFGQLTASLILDDVGALGMDKVQASAARICGVIAVLAGVILVQIGGRQLAQKSVVNYDVKAIEEGTGEITDVPQSSTCGSFKDACTVNHVKS